MDISDRRVVEFRQWAERKFGIGSGGYEENEDLLSVVMFAVEERERQWQDYMMEVSKPEQSPEFTKYMERAMGKDINNG